jgi:hypothetical protein
MQHVEWEVGRKSRKYSGTVDNFRDDIWADNVVADGATFKNGAVCMLWAVLGDHRSRLELLNVVVTRAALRSEILCIRASTR